MRTRATRKPPARTGVLPAYASAMDAATAGEAAQFRVGAQSYSFRKFGFEASLKCLKDLGLKYMEFCSVHFPPDAGRPEFSHIKATLQAEGIEVPCFGVEGFTEDAAANRKNFEFAKALGVEVLTADPTPDAFDNLDDLTDEFGIKVAIHNHGPGARYDKVADTLNAVKGHSPMIGACVDTGHAIRSGERPHEIIEELGDRTISVHIKDWTQGGEEQIIGQGDMDLAAVVHALRAIGFSGPVMIEYENSPENPVPDMTIGIENWNKAGGAA